MLIVVDLETSGKRSFGTYILEAAAVVVDDGVEIASFHTLSDPGEEAFRMADPEALAVNGITPELLRGAPKEAEAAEAFNAFLDRHWGGILTAFNNSFDLWFLARPPWRIASRRWGECVMLAAFEIMKRSDVLPVLGNGKVKWPRLAEAARFFGVSQDTSHRALGDARTAAGIYAEILARRRTAEAEEDTKYIFESGL